jgi:hypothetical protein
VGARRDEECLEAPSNLSVLHVSIIRRPGPSEVRRKLSKPARVHVASYATPEVPPPIGGACFSLPSLSCRGAARVSFARVAGKLKHNAARFLKYCCESDKRRADPRADPRVRTGPPGPVLRQWEQSHRHTGKPARGPAADQGVRPTLPGLQQYLEKTSGIKLIKHAPPPMKR